MAMIYSCNKTKNNKTQMKQNNNTPTQNVQ